MTVKYTHTDRDGDRIAVGDTFLGKPSISVGPEDRTNEKSAYLPTDQAELEKLASAILGREIAHVIYADELPGLTRVPECDDHDGRAYKVDDDRDWLTIWAGYHSVDHDDVRNTRRKFLRDLAVQRAEAERGETEVERLAKALHEATTEDPYWDRLLSSARDEYRAMARAALEFKESAA